FENSYYMWDAKKWFWDGVGNYPTENGQTAPNPPTESDPDRWYNTPTGYGPYNASYSAKDMPCHNALSWYIRELAYWDETTVWTLGGQPKTGGIWLKRWDRITGKSADATIYNCTSYSGYSTGVPRRGKPSADVIDQYFFLPALGYYQKNGDAFFLGNSGVMGYYWSSTKSNTPTDPGLYPNRAYVLLFSSSNIYIGDDGRLFGHVAGSRPNGLPWFQ
ncbi:MAG: hypothetical protein SPL55_05005, partial [Prevotella sp.]|nr:hypothetical protein [Prevotella sp.]